MVPFDAIPLFGLILVAIVIAGDIVFAVGFKSQFEGTTWSELIRESLPTTTLLPWVFGFWIGHWFPIVQTIKNPALSYMAALSVSLVVVIGGDFLMRFLKAWRRHSRSSWRLDWLPGSLAIVWVFGGVLVGSLALPLPAGF
jgi:hypothetical protein